MVGRSNGLAKPLILVWVFFLIFFPLMISLGFWQLDRADQKQSLLDEQERRSAEEPKEYFFERPPQRFERLRLEGHYQNRHLLLDNRQNKGQVGYELLTLFKTLNDKHLLVNRGWLGAPKYRSEFPEVGVPIEGSAVILEGYFYWPDKQLTVLESSAEEGAKNVWRVQSLEWEALESILGEAPDVAKEFRLLSEDIVGAESVYWDYEMMNPAKHHGYALQWFSMSFALLLLASITTYRLWRSSQYAYNTENNN